MNSKELQPDCSIDEIEDERVKLAEEAEAQGALLSNEELLLQRSAQQPDIDWLRDAIVDDIFVPVRNDYVVIEMYSMLDSRHGWLDTRVYQLLRDPAPDGYLKLYDVARKQCAQMNWKVGIKAGYQFKMPPSGRNPETLLESYSGRRKKLEKPAIINVPKQQTNTINVDGSTIKKHRGRPPGSKNRSKEEIQHDKDIRRQKIAQKRAKRAARLASRH